MMTPGRRTTSRFALFEPRGCSWWTAAIIVTFAARANAGDPRAAEALFQSAREALSRGDYDRACAQLEESQRLDPAVGTLMNLGACEEKRERFATAWTAYADARARMAPNDPRIEEAERKRAELAKRFATIRIEHSGAARGAAWTVRLDEVALGSASFGVPIPVDPGAHVVVAEREGVRPTRWALTLAQGEARVLTLPAEEAPAGQRLSPVLGWTLTGLGALALSGGVVAGALALDAKSTYRAHCDALGCDEEGLDAGSRGRALVIASPIALGIGALSVGAGAFLLLRSRSPSTAALRLVPTVGTSEAGIAIGGAL